MNKKLRSEKEWKSVLSPEEYKVLREKGTELAFSGDLLNNKKIGKYICGACGNKLFSSDTKYNSGSGWPSFWEAIKEDSIILKEDNTHGMKRTEAICSKCNSHLGHLFDDGPKPTKKRYCINSLSLEFKENETFEEAALGAGCFWHVQKEFDKLKGVISSEVGFMGGNEKKFPNPSYKQVCSGETGYIEVVKIIFNSRIIPYKKILEKFWNIHNPTEVNRQGPNIGDQYNSVIFYYNKTQEEEAKKSKEEKQREFSDLISTKILPNKTFIKAEKYHQKYLEKNGLNVCNLR